MNDADLCHDGKIQPEIENTNQITQTELKSGEH